MASRKSKKAFKRTEVEKIARKANYAREAKSCAKTKAFKRLHYKERGSFLTQNKH
jgi:hypothetical protein